MNPNDARQQELDKVHQAMQARQQAMQQTLQVPAVSEQQKHELIQAHNLQTLVLILLAALGVLLFVQWRKRRKTGGWE